MAAAAYRAPPCLSCAPTTARDPLSSSVSPHRDHAHLSNLFISRSRGLEGCSVRTAPATHPSLSATKRQRRRRRPNTSAGKVSCAFSNSPEVVTACSWNESVLCSDVPVLVEFWASWCGPCRMTHRVIEEIAREYAGRIKCLKLNTDEYPQVATFSSIEKIPTVLLFHNGEKIESITGTLPKSVYVTAIERSLAG